jgi:hypothetical protein
VLTSVAETVYRVGRPIDAGAIDQTYLWADTLNLNGTVLYHKGVDFPVITGTDVLATAAGVVVNLHEDLQDNNHTTQFGNFVLIQHNVRHWDQTNEPDGALSYVYTMYLHLSYNSIVPTLNTQVAAGDLIARSDNTGNSTGSHLHFQVVLHPEQDRTLEPNDSLESGLRSRNPELWLAPLSGRGTAIGKVTNADGEPIANLLVCGLRKGGTDTIPVRTYSFPAWANPDDILYENFGTTDVSPGTYTLHANARSRGCGATPHDYELGSNHTVTAGRVTYIGLYPSWLPFLRPASGVDWNVQTYVRNHAPSARSATHVSYFDNAQVLAQWRPVVNSYSSVLIDGELTSSYSGLVVPSVVYRPLIVRDTV